MTQKKKRFQVTFRSDYDTDDRIKPYGCSSLAIYALAFYLKIEDIDEFAANAITEGDYDKKIDICFLDIENKRLIISQNYISEVWNKKNAPDKASSLNTGLAWLFSANIDSVPEGLRDKANEIRKTLQAQDIHRIELFYIHNCHESKNIKDELKTVAASLKNILTAIMKEKSSEIDIFARELGLESIEELFKLREKQITIDEWIDLPIKKGNVVVEKTDSWIAVLTSVPAEWIQDLYLKYSNDLFSANYRDYLGDRDDEDNINNQIIQTANSEPENFLVYNNGITALTNKISFVGRWKRIKGISIINGAQTTGALGLANRTLSKKANVLIRFVECKDFALIDNIILFNNTQN